VYLAHLLTVTPLEYQTVSWSLYGYIRDERSGGELSVPSNLAVFFIFPMVSEVVKFQTDHWRRKTRRYPRVSHGLVGIFSPFH